MVENKNKFREFLDRQMGFSNLLKTFGSNDNDKDKNLNKLISFLRRSYRKLPTETLLSNMKDYSSEIIKASARLDKDTVGMSHDDLEINGYIRKSIILNLQYIGESSKHIDSKIKELNPDINWDNLRKLRNIVSHNPDAIEKYLIGSMVRQIYPQLLEKLENIKLTETDGEQNIPAPK